jgi:hypothetical protein
MATAGGNGGGDGHLMSTTATSTEPTGQGVAVRAAALAPQSGLCGEVENSSARAVPAAPTTDEARRWAHDVLNAFNALRLCTTAFGICDGLQEYLEILDQIERAAQRTAMLMDGSPDDLAH